MIAQIRAAPTNTMGWFEEDLATAWKHIFPITLSSVITGNLPLDHQVGVRTPNPWWKFLIHTLLILEKEAQKLNRLRRPLVMPHLDESGWLIQERRVIDFKGSVSMHMGNMPTMKLFQILKPIKRCDLLLCYREEIQGILNYMAMWKPNWVASKDLLRRLGWSMIALAKIGSNSMEIPNNHCSQMNILLWNCRCALNRDFKRRVFEMAVNHFPSVMVITETRVGGDRAAKIIEGLPFDGFFAIDTIGYAGGLWLLWKREEVEVFVLASTKQEIHATIKVCNSDLT